MKKQNRAQSAAQPAGSKSFDLELAYGRRAEELRKECEHLSDRELSELATNAAVKAAELMALRWERIWSAPTRN